MESSGHPWDTALNPQPMTPTRQLKPSALSPPSDVMVVARAATPARRADPRAVYLGPVKAEFGHELFLAAQLRHFARSRPNVTVCSTPGREALYADFCGNFIAHDIGGEASILWPIHAENIPKATRLRWAAPAGVEMFPLREYFGGPQQPAEFIVYGQPDAEFKDAVVIHARSRNHVHARNWPITNWLKLVEGLREKKLADHVVCIGSLGAALCVPECDDLRGLPLHRQMDVLRSARMAIGPSSGPMHLASLCKCPHVVWCGGGEHPMVITRYKKPWNPHGTPVSIVPSTSWAATPTAVYEAVACMIERKADVA